jgi:hypothetical protein
MTEIMDVNIVEMKADRKAYHEEMMACLGRTEADTEKTERDPGKMQFTEKHQEIPKREDAVMPVGEPRKRRRVCNLAVERRQKRKERTVGNRESRRKSAEACRMISHHAKMAWRKNKLFKKIGIL